MMHRLIQNDDEHSAEIFTTYSPVSWTFIIIIYAQMLMIRVGALPCNRNERADLTTLCPVLIQASEH